MADMAEAAPQPVAPASKPLAVAPAEPKPEVSAPPAEAGWSMSSWKWDPYNLRATAVLPGEGEDGAGRPVGNGEAVPPATAAAPAPLQPPLVPSYAMSTGSRAKGPPTCQVRGQDPGVVVDIISNLITTSSRALQDRAPRQGRKTHPSI